MAKQPVPEFNPYKAVTPVAQMTSFYRQPNILQVPDTGLGQIAEALQGLSPTLMGAIDDQAEAANKAEITEGQIAAEKLSADQARAASRGNFVQLEKDGVIPKGASPFRLAAMQQSIGKKVVQADLNQLLNNNIQRFSDPYNEEDAGEFVQQQFVEMTTGMGFYAQGAATEALDTVERNFLSRTSLLKSEKRAEQNQRDLTSDVFNIFNTPAPDGFDPAQSVAWFRGQIQTRMDEYHATTGQSGLEDAWIGITAAARELARNGDDVGADALIDAAEGVMIGDRSLIEDKAVAFNALRNKIDEDYEKYEDDQDRDLEAKERINTRSSNRAHDHFYTKLSSEELMSSNVKDMQPEIIEFLQSEEGGGLSAEEARLASARTIKLLQSSQRQTPMDRDSLAEITRFVTDDSLSTEKKLEMLIPYANRMSPEDYISYMTSINERGSVNRVTGQLLSRVNTRNNNRLRQLAEAQGRIGLDPQGAFDQRSSIESRLTEELEKIATGGGTIIEQEQAYNEIADQILSEEIAGLSGELDEEVPEDASPATLKAIEETRLRRFEEEEEQAAVLTTPGTSWYWPDSLGERNLETLQSKDSTLTQIEEAKKDIYKNALLRRRQFKYQTTPQAREMTRANPRGFTELSTAEENEEVRMASVVGFTLEEIKELKTENGVEISPNILDPRFSVLIPGMETPEQFKEYAETDEGKAAILEVLKALPPSYQFGTDKEDQLRFIGLQAKVLMRYRPSKVTPSEETK